MKLLFSHIPASISHTASPKGLAAPTCTTVPTCFSVIINDDFCLLSTLRPDIKHHTVILLILRISLMVKVPWLAGGLKMHHTFTTRNDVQPHKQTLGHMHPIAYDLPCFGFSSLSDKCQLWNRHMALNSWSHMLASNAWPPLRRQSLVPQQWSLHAF